MQVCSTTSAETQEKIYSKDTISVKKYQYFVHCCLLGKFILFQGFSEFFSSVISIMHCFCSAFDVGKLIQKSLKQDTFF